MGKKALALLIAMLTIGQSFAMSGSAALDNVQHKDTSLSAASDGTGTFEFSITRHELQRAVQSSTQQSIKQTAINAPVVDTTQLTKGYSVDSKKFDLRNVNGKCYSTPVRSQAPFGTCWSFATIAAIESSILGAGLNGADGKQLYTIAPTKSNFEASPAVYGNMLIIGCRGDQKIFGIRLS